MEHQSKIVNRAIFFSLWAACVVGFWSILPCLQYLGVIPFSVSLWKVFFLGTLQTVLFFGLVCWLSFKILPQTDLHPFRLHIRPAVVTGILVGGAIFLIDKAVFHSSLLAGSHPPRWMGAVASIYGAVNEEVLLRFFLFTFFYYLLGKCAKINRKNRLYFLWVVNIVVALLFGLGHLPAAFKLITPSAVEIFRILFLNGIAGVIFGWLYWSRGLWTAMAAHFVADLMLHVFLT